MRASHRLPLILLVGAVLLAHEPARDTALAILRLPFTLLTQAVGILMTLPRVPSLQHENERLRAELTQRQVELAQAREALRHSQQAAAVLAAYPAGGVVAQVIGYSTIPSQRTILLDRGAQHGIRVGTVVLDASGLVGRVSDTQPTTALVLLVTDPDSRVAGIVERSRETGLLVGTSRALCEFTSLPIDTDLQPGDRVLTAGLGGMFPKGLALGTVVRIVKDDASGTAWASVKPAARLDRLEEILCLPPYVSPP